MKTLEVNMQYKLFKKILWGQKLKVFENYPLDYRFFWKKLHFSKWQFSAVNMRIVFQLFSTLHNRIIFVIQNFFKNVQTNVYIKMRSSTWIRKLQTAVEKNKLHLYNYASV